MHLPKNLQLTKWGEAQLTAFPLDAVEYADRMLPMVKSATTPWQKFINLCIEYCRSNGIKIDWASAKEKLKGKPSHEDFYVKPHQPVHDTGRRAISSVSTYIVQESQKGEVESDGRYTGIITYIGNIRCRELIDGAANQRRASLVNSIEFDQSIMRFSLLMGKKYAEDYLARVLNNLKYEEIT